MTEEREYTEQEQDLLSIKGMFERLFANEGGTEAIEFLKQVTGYKFPLPLSTLAIAEGARRTVCLIDILVEPNNPKAFLAYCAKRLTDDKFLQ